MSVPCPPGCQCRKHLRCPEGCTCTRHHSGKRLRALPEIALAPEVAKPEPKPLRQKSQAESLWSSHRLTPEDWDAMWAAQQGCCYLCGDPLSRDRRRVYIEHDHRCCGPNRTCQDCRRGLSCASCNTAIGLAGDDPARLRRIADNLEVASAIASLRLAEQRGMLFDPTVT